MALVLLAAVLTPTHPNHKGRMLHSWLPAVWVLAGLGTGRWGAGKQGCGACSVSEGNRLPSLTLQALSPLSLLCFICVLGVSVVSSSSLLGHTVEGGAHTEFPSMLDVTDAYLADVPDGRRTLLLTSLPMKPMAQWTWLERFGNFEQLEERWYGFRRRGGRQSPRLRLLVANHRLRHSCFLRNDDQFDRAWTPGRNAPSCRAERCAVRSTAIPSGPAARIAASGLPRPNLAPRRSKELTTKNTKNTKKKTPRRIHRRERKERREKEKITNPLAEDAPVLFVFFYLSSLFSFSLRSLRSLR